MANLHNAGYGKHGLAFSASLLLVGRGQVAQLLLLQNYFWWHKRERTLAYVIHVPERHWCTTCTTEVVYGGIKKIKKDVPEIGYWCTALLNVPEIHWRTCTTEVLVYYQRSSMNPEDTLV